MTAADIIVLGHRTLGRVRDRLFGQFIELAGRCINDGLYDPASPLARADGLRGDVVEALKELRPGYLRYPGGCAAAYFDWQDLVGPRSARPRATAATRSPPPSVFPRPTPSAANSAPSST